MKKNTCILLLLFGIMLISCDDLLNIEPKDKLTTTTSFKTYANFKTYSWGLYNIFSSDAMNAWDKDKDSHLMVNNNSSNNNVWAYQNVTEATDNKEWEFEYIRRVNTMLDNVDGSDMIESEKAHWRSVGLFFRSYRYFQLLSKYGGVPWIEHVIGENDTDVLYGPRASRDEVAANILRDLEEAEKNIKPAGDGDNTINQKVVQALISRFAIFEGTWRKYHGMNDAEKYLQVCADYSRKLIDAVPNVANSYELLFTSESLAGMPGVLLYFEYSDKAGLTHQAGRQSAASGNLFEGTKDLVNLYLCSDGKPIGSSELYEGDATAFDEFRNRDYRLYFTIVPPYRVKVNGNNDTNWKRYQPGETVTFGANTYVLTEEECQKFTENIDLLERISDPGHKRLPSRAWNASTLNGSAPRFRSYSQGGGTPFTGRFGYWFWKYYNEADCLTKHAQNTTDMARFRIEETMLNYAEAMCELGQFDQSIADLTINKLRPRANVAPMKVVEITDSFDPNRDQTVPALLWEIRRERSVELLGENFAFDDIRRWRKGSYLDKELTGCRVKNTDYDNTLEIQGYGGVAGSANKEGYVVFRQKPKGFLDHYYLYPIPIKELVLNPQLKQNPGYKETAD